MTQRHRFSRTVRRQGDSAQELAQRRSPLSLRILSVLTVLLGTNYVVWRWFFSVNWDAWWIGVALVAAETYSLVDVFLFALTMWRAGPRPLPPAPALDYTVDVFITTYNEPIELVMKTARAALAVRYPHRTWILDDGARPEMRVAADEAGVGYITRGAHWDGYPRHAKAGNVNNALMQTGGEFILILDADQIPRPEILEHTLGYFNDPKVALIQTPQIFSNVATGDPLGSQAPLFYGPIQRGKDGWNAAFFCGSNALLRRDALMQLGIIGYVRNTERGVSAALRAASRALLRSRNHPAAQEPAVAAALDSVSAALALATEQIRKSAPIADVTYRLHQTVDAASRQLVAIDLAGLDADLAEIRELARPGVRSTEEVELDVVTMLDSLAMQQISPLQALESLSAALRDIAVDQPDEAQPVMPLATISVTEDMATSMRLHRLGWKSVYHHEQLADGLAPEDLGTMLNQRLRWAQGTMQVFLRENPLVQRGMSVAQRLMYFATMWSYLSGFAAVVYFAGPIIFLCLGILPVSTTAVAFFERFIPFMIANQLLFLVAARGAPTWRGQQYSLALFPTWIKACSTAFNNVVLRIPLGFIVTPKTRPQSNSRLGQWRLIKPQLVMAVLLILSIAIGIVRLVKDNAPIAGTGVNIAWAVFDLLALSVLLRALAYRGYEQ